ncbi:cytochrome c biogenesis CcdA family protein [Desulfurispira natronophila]|uniref:Cytochrome c-type biogenesis protein n=1 Tax=Desulfurispira natronophila TaxID=682562 RepID=A0A7W7Y2M5_9BACT|nr:cytochrome c biogenesis protein CcdA [Desulfurispira natronophila]MBB5020946.1 cytochrome c-type biogenesis protein [Desulfurispira natronophila]
MDITLWTAFIAGFLAFVSPCLLPLIPGYLSFISGGAARLENNDFDRMQVFMRSIWFVLGFSTIFVLMGASATALGLVLLEHQAILARVAGVVIFLFGLHYARILPIKWLYYERRVHLKKVPTGPLGAVLMGFAFALGWTPCIGPILAAILTIAASRETIFDGMILLSFFSAGMGIPFILCTLLIGQFLKVLRHTGRTMRIVEIVSGLLLMGIGIMIFTGYMGYIAAWLMEVFPSLATI